MRIPFLVVVLDFLRQEEDWQAEHQHQYDTGKFLPLAQQTDLPAVIPVEVKDGIREPRRMKPALRTVYGCELHLLDQGRYQEKGYGQRDSQIDNHNGGKVLQVQPDSFIEEEDDCQGTDSGQRGCQNGKEGFQVVPPPDVIGHHNGVVDDKA